MQICANTVPLYKSDFEVRIGILVIFSSSLRLAIVAILRIWSVGAVFFERCAHTFFDFELSKRD